jgi:hypothetical protein
MNEVPVNTPEDTAEDLSRRISDALERDARRYTPDFESE